MIAQITTVLQPLDPFPHRLTVTEDEMVIQGEAFFDQLQQDFQPELSDIIDEINAVNTEINTLASNAENNAILANGLVNFKGAWSDITTYAKGESVESTAGSKIYYISKVDGNLNNVVIDTTYWLLNPINDKLDKDTAVLTAKTSLVDADVVLMGDSVTSNITKKITWVNLKATIKSYTDTLYISLTGNQIIDGVKTFSSSPIVPTPTTPTQVMNLGVYNNGLGKQGYTHTADATFTGADNKIVMTGIVTALGLEVGDVITFNNANAANNKPHTVESITDANTIIVNYEHCSARGNGSLKLFDQTVTNANCKLLAKWFVAPVGLGQEWVNVIPLRASGASVNLAFNRDIEVSLSSVNNIAGNSGISSITNNGAIISYARSVFNGDDFSPHNPTLKVGTYSYNYVVPNTIMEKR